MYQPNSNIMNQNNAEFISAARTGDVNFLRASIIAGADVNVVDEKGYTPLIIACYNNQLAAAEVLLNAKADINKSDAGGNTALMGVCFKGYAAIALQCLKASVTK